MSAFSDAILALSPDGYWRLNESTGGPIDSASNHSEGTYHNSPTLQATGLVGDGDKAVTFDGVDQYASVTSYADTTSVRRWTVYLLAKSDTAAAARTLWEYSTSADEYVRIVQDATGALLLQGGFWNFEDEALEEIEEITISASADLTSTAFIVVHYDASGSTGYAHVSGAGEFIAPTSYGWQLPRGAGTHYIGSGRAGTSPFDGTIDDVAFLLNQPFDSETDADDIWALVTTEPPLDTIPLTLRGRLAYTGTSIPLRLLGGESITGSSIPLKLSAPDPDHFTAAACAFGVKVVLDGTDISARITGPVRISHEENASGLCTIEVTPETGTLDLADYERKSLAVSFVGLDSDGSTLYTRRRWTGITSTATHDPDAGTLTVEGTTDLQGLVEGWSREVIENALPGTLWSQHIFDETADGWQYALDRLSTLPAEIHLDEWGRFVLVPWAAKATADIVYTDAERFDGSLRLDRVAIRDLLTRITINIDFRYARLRYREIGVGLSGGLSFCEWLDGWGTAPSKDMIRSAADGSEWTRVSDIRFNTFPPAGSYCNPLRGWVPTEASEALCLTARWKAARRWAQTVTEQYAITVYAPDLEEAVGQIALEEDYGLEAIYDATDYEQDRSWNERPGGFVLKAATNDWESEATDIEYAGRAELEVAEECAIEKAKTEILRRARLNRVTFQPVYRPDVSLSSTVEVDTPYLACTGKVARIEETIDPTTGTLDQTLEIALSRHGGSGLAATTPTAPVTQPEMPAEEPTPRSYTVQYRIGGTTNAQEDDPTWDGFVTNVQPFRRVPGEPLYETRFVLNMPEIEATARESIEVPAAESFELEVPQDPLTIGV